MRTIVLAVFANWHGSGEHADTVAVTPSDGGFTFAFGGQF